MINKITIHELAEATSFSYKENFGGYNAWISTVDEQDRHKINRMRRNFESTNLHFKFFSQFFYDWSDEDNDPYIKNRIELMGPQKYQIQNIITFIKENLVNSNKTHNLGINCFAGISRSTAVGILAWTLQGKSIEESLNLILKVRPQAHPNLRILRFATEITGIDMFSPIQNFIQNNKGTIYIPSGGYVW